MSLREPDRDKNWAGRNLRWIIVLLGVIGLLLVLNSQAFGQGASRKNTWKVYNPVAEGRHSEGDDITVSLQRALDKQHEHKLPIVIPCGKYYISSTITMPYAIGGMLLGSGYGAPGDTTGAVTDLRWNGSADGTMFNLRGSHITMGNFAISATAAGDERYRDGNGAKIGILVSKPSTGIGTGQSVFLPIEAQGFKYAVEVGTSAGMHNCDDLHFHRLRAINCEAAYHGVNLQGMGIRIDNLVMYEFDATEPRMGLFMEGGGDIHVEYALSFGGPLLVVDSSSSATAVGRNNGIFVFNTIKIDSDGGSDFQLCDIDCQSLVRVVVNSGIQSYDGDVNDETPDNFINIKGPGHVRINNFSGLYGPITGDLPESGSYQNFKPTVIIRDGYYFRGSSSILTDGVSGDVYVKAEDMYHTSLFDVEVDSSSTP